MAGYRQGIITAFDHVVARLSARLDGLSDPEYFWEPTAGCWSLRKGADGRWRLDGGGGGGPAPSPVPVTTIAWRLGHVAGLGLAGFADRLFGPGTLGVDGLGFAPAAAGAVPFLEENYGRWRDGLVALEPAAWDRPLGPAWGPYAESSTEDLVLHVFDELVHHGAEIGLLRDLYRARLAP